MIKDCERSGYGSTYRAEIRAENKDMYLTGLCALFSIIGLGAFLFLYSV